MRRLPLLSLFFLPVLAHAQTKPDRTTPLQSRSESRALVQQLLRQGKIMAPSQARRGMKGYALSVFQGTRIEKFDVEVLGVLERVQGGGDLVLIKVTSGPVVTRQSGIIQGMSGSPVYIGGKLLGAIAIGFGFPKEPIGGVTPITQMIATALPDNGPSQPNPDAKKLPIAAAFDLNKLEERETYRPQSALSVAGRRIARLEVTHEVGSDGIFGPADAATLRLRPATQMLLLSGVSESGLNRWRAMLAPYGITPVLGGGAMGSAQRSAAHSAQAFGMPSRKTGVSANLAPGAAIGVQLASGDIDATGVGTVTYRLGNRVLAFGHPMFNLGAVSMPMTTAFVQDIFPAYDISFKLASPIQSVGELQQDTNFAIGGTVGRRAETVPVRLTFVDGAKKLDKRFNVRLIKDPTFTPQLAQSIAVEAAQSVLGLDSDKTVRVSLSIGLKNGPAIRRVNTVYAPDQVVAGALGELLDALSITQANPYEKGNIASIDLRAQVIASRKTARIRRLYSDKNRVRAGESVQITVVLEPTGQPDAQITRRFTVRVPDDAPAGTLRIAATSAADYFASRVRVGGAPPRVGNFRELLDAYAQIGANNELLLQTSTPRRFLLLDRKRVSNPPPSWARLVAPQASSSSGAFNETQTQKESEDYVVSGGESLTIPVESKRSSDRARPDSPSADDAASSVVATASASSDASASDDATSSDDGDDSFVSAAAPRNGAAFSLAARALPTRTELDGAPDFARRAEPLLGLLMQIPVPKPEPPVPTEPQLAPTPAAPIAPPLPGAASATPTPAPSSTPTPTPTPTPDAGAATIARPAGRWIQRTSTDFGRGQFDGTLVSDDGTLRVGPRNQRLASSAEPVAWSVAADGQGTVYLGTGNSARLLKIKNGVTSVLYQGPEVAVTALALDKNGDLYAGVSPGGRVYRFAPDGSHQTVLQTGQTFVHALAFDSNGALIVATGGESGQIYRVQNPSQVNEGLIVLAKTAPSPLATLPQKHARSLSVVGDAIYVGTANDAVLYRVDQSGGVTALYQATGASALASAAEGGGTLVVSSSAPGAGTTLVLSAPGAGNGSSNFGGNEITAIAAQGQNVYFGTLTSGSIYRWNAARGVTEAFKTSGSAIYALQMVGDTLFAATGEKGEVWRVTNLDGDAQGARVLDATQPQVLALATAGNRVLAATGNNAAVYEIGGAGANSFTSNVFDAGQVVRFGALRSVAQGATFEFRSGNTLEPDATWTAWRAVQNGESVGATNSATNGARYAQYRVHLGEGGSLSRLEVAFRAPNRAPRVAWATPSGGDYLSGSKTFDWSGSDADKDPLRYTLEIVGEGGKAQPVVLTSATASSQEVDTKKYADGTYTARVSASDAARNPDDPQTDAATSLPFTVDNTPPTLATPTVTKEGALWNVQFAGSDALSPLAGAEWRLVPVVSPTPSATTAPTGAKTPAKSATAPTITATAPTATATSTVTVASTATSTATTESAASAKPSDWQAAASSDSLFDSKTETVVARLDPAVSGVALKSGDTIELRLRDAAGNATTSKITLP